MGSGDDQAGMHEAVPAWSAPEGVRPAVCASADDVTKAKRVASKGIVTDLGRTAV